MAFLLICLTSCTMNAIQPKGDQVTVQKRVAETSDYTLLHTINNPKQVQSIRNIASTIQTNNVIADMVRPPDFKFFFKNKERAPSDKNIVYDLWVSPNEDQVEIIIEGQHTYVQLDKKQSANLFELLTDEKLPGNIAVE